MEDEAEKNKTGLYTAAGIIASTALLTGVYYATPKETKDRIKNKMRKTGDE